MNNLKRYLFLACLGLSISSCDKFIEGYDVNPNLPQDAPADQQLTAVELSEGFTMGGEMARTAAIWSDYFTGFDRQYEALQSYTTSATDYDNMWANSYQLTLANARLVQQKAAAVNNKQLQGIGQVLEAQMIGTVTSLWGNVPYSQALVPGQPAKFDNQADIYAAIQTQLSSAITNLGLNGVSPGDRDIFYQGSTAKWQTAAHSLKARYYLHVKNYAQAVIEARLGIADASGDMLVPYAGTVGASDNPYYDFIDIQRSGYMVADNAYALRLLNGLRNNAKTNEADRFAYFYTDQAGYGNPYDANIVDGAFAADAPFPLISYVENQAILAEALARTNDLNGALNALNSIRAYNRAQFAGGTYLNYTLADFATGGLLNPGGTNGTQTNALIKEILTEKYLSLVGQIEPFTDIRRTNNLIGVPKKNPNSPDLPQRYLLPQSEVNANPNTPSPIPSLFQKTPVNQ